MGGGTSSVGFGWPGVNDELGAGVAGRPPDAESTGDVEAGATQAPINHATARTRMSRVRVRIVG